MKHVLILLISLAWLQLDATPSEDSYAAVTNDWYQGNFSNVYELAQCRLAVNSNDVVATYLMHGWYVSFGTRYDISNSVNRLLLVSDTVTNQNYTAIFSRLRPAYIEYRDHFLSTVTDEQIEAERYKSYLPGRLITGSYVLRHLEKEGLWVGY